MFCQHCGARVDESWANCGACGGQLRFQGGPPLASKLGEHIKESSRDAASALRTLARDPVSGMVASWKALGAARAQAAGFALCIGFAVCVTIGATIAARKTLGGLLALAGYGGEHYFKTFLAVLVLPATVALAALGIRRLMGCVEGFSADVFTAGAALSPLGVVSLISGVLGFANAEVMLLLFLVASSYLVLMLYRGLTAIGGLSERAGPPAVPVLIALSAWLTKVVLVALS